VLSPAASDAAAVRFIAEAGVLMTQQQIDGGVDELICVTLVVAIIAIVKAFLVSL
jgi:hypothetical protein